MTYTQKFMKNHGDVKRYWQLHKRHMIILGEPYVDYNAFYCRIFKREWSLFKAMYSPADLKKVGFWKKVWLTIRTKWLYIRYKFTSLFKKDEKHFRVRRNKG